MLVAGAKVLLLSPAFAVGADVAQNAIKFWQQMGMQPVLMAHALGSYNAYSGTDAERFADFLAALQDPEAAVIHCLRGGYGLTRILDDLPLKELLTAYPKHLIGFSDITAGLLAWQKAGYGHLAIHGPMAAHLEDTRAEDVQALPTLLTTGTLKVAWRDASATDSTRISASITGGNLTLLAHSIGSRYPLRAEGHILFIEEVGEQLYHIDRMMRQLKRAGLLDGIVGILLGHFTEVNDLKIGFGATVAEIIRDCVGPHVPIAAGFSAGHNRPNYPIPFGVEATLEANAGSWRLII